MIFEAIQMLHVRHHFPSLKESIRGIPLIYLDSAATSLKPRCVIDAVSHFYATQNSNVHRGVHYLSGVASDLYDATRIKCQHFINAEFAHEIIFCSGTTEAVNLVAATYGRANVKSGDEILVTEMEHHSNIVPWQVLAEEKSATLKVMPVDSNGNLVLDTIHSLINSKTKIVALTHVSNVLGTVNNIKYITDIAHLYGAKVFVDGAQSASHMKIDVKDLNCDFYAFSGHKVYGPTGIGVLYGKSELLDSMPPYHTGGGMIRSVSFNKTSYAELPNKFEAGTPHIAGVVGLGTAIDFLCDLYNCGLERHEQDILIYASQALSEIDGLRIVGTSKNKHSVISFTLRDIHAHDIGTILDSKGIAIRTGHHCAEPLHHKLGLTSTARASFACYSTKSEVDSLVKALDKVKRIFAKS
jgi:cysteine desulfurase/selenocysteine lyase